jgi:predicted regulator of Ras-like GTPase activity (Roadblock/LC7/MglB family)
MSSEVEETLKRINSHKGVKGVLIMNSEGTNSLSLVQLFKNVKWICESTFFNFSTRQIASSLINCVNSARKSSLVTVSSDTKHHLNSLRQWYIVGIPIRSNLSDEDTENYAALVSQLAIKAHHVVRYYSLLLNYLHVTHLNFLLQRKLATCNLREEW